MFYLAETVYRDPLPFNREELEQSLQGARVAHIADGMAQGLVILGGPKAGGRGGFLLLRSDSRREVGMFLAADPLVIRGVLYFRVTPWRILDFPPDLAAVFGPSGS